MAIGSDITGVVLAGGLGRRMGADKALLTLAGRPLLDHAARRLAPQTGRLCINANGDPSRFGWLGLPVIPDETGDRAGPLAGVLAAIRWTSRNLAQSSALVSVTGDAPFIPHDLVSRLSEALASSPAARVAVARSRGRRHHVIALWLLEAAPDIAAALAGGERRVETVVDRLGAATAEFPDIEIGGAAVDPFFNVNTPDDLEAAARILSRQATDVTT